jgi:hypothetical protein
VVEEEEQIHQKVEEVVPQEDRSLHLAAEHWVTAGEVDGGCLVPEVEVAHFLSPV